MKIGSTDYGATLNSSVSQTNARSERSATAVASSSAAQSTRTPGVAVTMSSMARGLEKSTRAGGEVDMQKVSTVKAAIQDGTYTVNPEAIADKMMSGAKEMLRSTPR